VLEIKELSKSYSGTMVLDGISLSVNEKGIYGILGAKSTGKTALARLICGIEDADAGEILVGEKRMSRKALALRKKARYVPSSLEMLGVTTPSEYLDLVGSAMGVASEKRYRQIKEAIELCGLESVQNKPFSTITRASRAKLSLAASLMGNPDVIVLDAPFGGLDERSLADIYEVLRMISKIKTVILFSFKPSQVKELCDSVAILGGGRIAVSGSIKEIEQRLCEMQQLHITVRGEVRRVTEAIKQIDSVVGVSLGKASANNVNELVVEHKSDDRLKDKIFSVLSEIGAPMLSVKAVKLTLDDVFYSLSSTKDGSEGGAK
jgi:ABC-type multidrug transport system ATPase subunit